VNGGKINYLIKAMVENMIEIALASKIFHQAKLGRFYPISRTTNLDKILNKHIWIENFEQLLKSNYFKDWNCAGYEQLISWLYVSPVKNISPRCTGKSRDVGGYARQLAWGMMEQTA